MERVLPATVHIEARIPQEHPSARLLGSERMGSGAVVDADGLVLTVNYVVLGADQVTVTLLDHRSLTGQVVRHDFASGLALVRIPEQRLPALPRPPAPRRDPRCGGRAAPGPPRAHDRGRVAQPERDRALLARRPVGLLP